MPVMMRKAITNVTSILNNRWYAESKKPYIFPKVMIMKTIGQLFYQELVLNVAKEIAPVMKTKL